MENQMTLREFIKKVENNDYNRSTCSMIEMGWYDWFCTDTSLYGRFKKLLPKLLQVVKSEKINLDTMYVFFKNNCPATGPTYDNFRICNIESGDVLYTISKMEYGCYGNSYSGFTMYYTDPERGWGEWCKGWREIRKYFGV